MIAFIWCSKAIQIRTVFVADSFLQFREGDGFRAFLVVEGDHHFIIVQENRIDEGVDEHLAVALLPHVQLTETVEPEGHKLCADLGLRQLFAGKPVLKLVAAVFQLLQPRLCGARQDALLNGVEQIADGSIRFTELLLIQRHVHIVPVLQVHEHGYNGLDCFVVHYHFHGFTDHQILDPFFPDGHLVALGALLYRLKTAGHTIILSEHRFHYVRDSFDRLVFMEDGAISAVYDRKDALSLRYGIFLNINMFTSLPRSAAPEAFRPRP